MSHHVVATPAPVPRAPFPPRVSVATALYNEERGVAELLRRVGGVLDVIPGGPHEIVVVDDGSTDMTLPLLEAAAARDARITIVSLSRNFGQQAAFTAALDHVSGDAVVVMDGDLQDPPEIIPELLAQHADGYDVVYVTRANRKESPLLRACYFLFYRVLAGLSTMQVPPDAGDFGLLSRRVVDEMRRLRERHRFLRGLRKWVGFHQTAVAIDRPERYAGPSRYTVAKLLRLASDGLFAFSIVPIRAAALLGACAMGGALVFAIYSLYAKAVMHQSPRGFTALTLLVTFLGGINLFFLGVIGEYVGRVYEEVKGRPIYVVEQIVRGGARAGGSYHPLAALEPLAISRQRGGH